MSTTAVSDFYGTLRFLLGDHDPAFRQYPDEVLREAVLATVRLNRAPGLTVDADPTQLTPAITDPNLWALLAYYTVRGFVASHPDKYSYKTRALGESFGAWRNFLDELSLNIYRLENGCMFGFGFSAWMNYYTWLAGMSGLPLDQVMTTLNVRGGNLIGVRYGPFFVGEGG